MKNNKKLILAGLLLAGSLLTINGQASTVQAKSYGKAVTKIAGNGNYAIYHNVSSKGPSGKFTSTKYFKHGQIQSKKSMSTKKGTFWRIIVDGRDVGWVN
ncbi:hypothetical protein IMAU30002_01704 [Lactobacillus helveticus]|nr:hypothetical protein [Lactobacillus helveticus]NRO39547.1 hypothetical protein [Lactobacillus helveticus]